MKVRLDEIAIEDRVRDVAAGPVKAIAESFKLVGQSIPVLVHKAGNAYRLIDGGHRIAAAKSLGWTEIEADVKDFTGLDAQEIEFAAKLIEIDTTIARTDLSTGLETDLLERRLRIIVQKNAYEEAKKAQQEKEAAEQRERETRAALRAAEKARSEIGESFPKNRAKKLEDELAKAEQERVNAAKRAVAALERRSEIGESFSKNGTIPENLHGIGKARKELAAQTNRKPDIIKKSMRWFEELGRDFVKKLYGTELDNHMQYLAMSRLKKRFEETTAEGFARPDTPDGKTQAMADRLVQSYWPRCVNQIERFGAGEVKALPNPHAEYADIIREEKQGFKANEEIRRLETADGQWDRVRDLSSRLHELLTEFHTTVSGAKTDTRIKNKSAIVARMKSQADELRLWARKG